jgi:MFS family permease
MNQADARLGPIALAQGVRRLNAGIFLFAAFLGVAMTTFVSAIQPYVLSVNVGLAVEEQGRVSGQMVFYGELVLLTLSSLIGVWSDRIGRRAVFLAGMMMLAVGYLLYAFVDSVATLTTVRVFMALGIAAVNVMVSALMVDYPAETSRGKLAGATGAAIGVGAILIGVVFLQLPQWYAASGADSLWAGRLALFTMAVLCALLGIVLRIGLQGGPPPHTRAGDSLREQFAQGLVAGRENPRVLLAYLCAFVARADLVVVGTFYTLWLTQAGIRQGMSAAEAAGVAGGFFAMVMTCALIWAPVMGWLNDRLDRVSAMGLAMLLAGVGYVSMWFIPDPLGLWMWPAGVLLGIGQMSAVTASQTLIGQEAPPAYRGSVVGMFSFFGAAGILFITTIGGRLYDAIDPAAPFLLIGVVNTLLFLWALRVPKARTQ